MNDSQLLFQSQIPLLLTARSAIQSQCDAKFFFIYLYMKWF